MGLCNIGAWGTGEDEVEKVYRLLTGHVYCVGRSVQWHGPPRLLLPFMVNYKKRIFLLAVSVHGKAGIFME